MVAYFYAYVYVFELVLSQIRLLVALLAKNPIQSWYTKVD